MSQYGNLFHDVQHPQSVTLLYITYHVYAITHQHTERTNIYHFLLCPQTLHSESPTMMTVISFWMSVWKVVLRWDPCKLAKDMVQSIQKHLRLIAINTTFSSNSSWDIHFYAQLGKLQCLILAASYRTFCFRLWDNGLPECKQGSFSYSTHPLLPPFLRWLSRLMVLSVLFLVLS